MPALFNRLPGHHTSPPGLERRILRKLPRSFGRGLLALALPSLLARALAALGIDGPHVPSIDIWTLGLLVGFCNAVVAIGIAAFVVMVMKGPAYVADAYPLPDAEEYPPPMPHRD